MKIGVIGSGNVATVLGRLLIKNNHIVTQVISRDITNAKALAVELNAYGDDFTVTPDINADVILIAIADAALQSSLEHFEMGNKLVVHTAGSVSRRF